MTAEEISEVVYAYARGQIITSVLFGTYTLIVLHVFRVPAALPLAVLAGLCDVIPLVGIILATVPAVLLALTLSPGTAAIVLVFYVGYHLLEAYLIVPRVYGQRLRLSTLAVLLALMAGTTLQGLVGAVLVLPLVAAYPIIERIWLAGYLGAGPQGPSRACQIGGAGERGRGRHGPARGAASLGGSVERPDAADRTDARAQAPPALMGGRTWTG